MQPFAVGNVWPMPESLGLPHDALSLGADAPVSLQLAVAMRWAIIQQQVPEGTQLPSEPDMAEWFGISRDTVSRAFGVLRHAGIIATRRGKGHFVIHVPEFVHIELPPGTIVTVRRPTTAADRAAIEAGSQLYSPVVEILRPGEPPEIRDSACVQLEFRVPDGEAASLGTSRCRCGPRCQQAARRPVAWVHAAAWTAATPWRSAGKTRTETSCGAARPRSRGARLCRCEGCSTTPPTQDDHEQPQDQQE